MKPAWLLAIIFAGCAYHLHPVDYDFAKPKVTAEELDRDRSACEQMIYASWRAGLAASNTALISKPPEPRELARHIPDALPACMASKGYTSSQVAP